MGQDMFRTAFRQHFALGQDICAIADAQRLAHIVVGNEHSDLHVLEILNQFLNVYDGDGINAGKRFIQQHKGGLQ